MTDSLNSIDGYPQHMYIVVLLVTKVTSACVYVCMYIRMHKRVCVYVCMFVCSSVYTACICMYTVTRLISMVRFWWPSTIRQPYAGR